MAIWGLRWHDMTAEQPMDIQQLWYILMSVPEDMDTILP